MPEKPLRIIIDTNLWISFLIRNDYSRLDDILFSGNCILIFSSELLEEFLSVVKRPKFRKYFSQSDIESVLETIDEYAKFVRVTSQIDICRDAKDNFLLSLAADSSADYLLTGDNDLLELRQFEGTKIVKIADFLS
ncbi:putative toxin-antitoxin system toxin component, PIN family [Dyadobacter luticola]|uniref:Putative toxin-antitoxin system toxin component, PIN family n=1 Tax=Dyadobacter luticola TaxID=1979387 RepID=A0A5R9L2G9_9BACT|nr:putative toxin-antitoxin system toxin component, PIN family [Dyadobacter luticola]TLV02733.1 putative toxin-antitoxin system toxin component, PIN family [Dyadobacter luticola]